jgi:hypothetical protein
VSKNEYAESDITKSTKKKSKKTIEKDTTVKSWTRNCPKCKKKLTHKRKHSRDNSERNNRVCWSCSNSGENNPFYGKQHSQSHKKYISELATSRREDVRKKLSVANKGKTIDTQTRQKISKSLKKHFSIPENRSLLSDRARAAYIKNPLLREVVRVAALRQQEVYRTSEEYKQWQSKKTEYELYKIQVLKLTFENDLAKLDNWPKRNLYHKYEIDHIYPIRQGFKNGIPETLIGGIENLRIIPREENRRKGGKITIIPEHIQVYLNNKEVMNE